MKKKNLPMLIDCPELSKKDINKISKIAFRSDDKLPKKADLIFIFGNLESIENILSNLYNILDKKISNKVIVSGGINSRRETHKIVYGYDSATVSEGEIFENIIDRKRYPNLQLFSEREADSSKENVTLSLKIKEAKMAEAKSIVFISRSYHSGRAYRSLKKYIPNAKLYQISYNSCADDKKHTLINKENWYTSKISRATVWGEISRIYNYGYLKNDIYFDEEDFKIYSSILEHLK